MVTRISGIFKKYAKGRIIPALFGLYVLFNIAVLSGIHPRLKALSGGIGPVDLQFCYSPGKAYSMIESYGDAGRAFYRNYELTGDIIYPIVFALFFGLLIAWLFKRGVTPESKLHKLCVVPLGAWLFDLLENITIILMISFHPARVIILPWLATAFTMMKWILALAAILLVLTGFVLALKNGFKKDSNNYPSRQQSGPI